MTLEYIYNWKNERNSSIIENSEKKLAKIFLVSFFIKSKNKNEQRYQVVNDVVQKICPVN